MPETNPTPEPQENAGITLSSPWDELDLLFDRVQRDLLPTFAPSVTWTNFRSLGARAAIDIEDTGTAYELKADLPGFSKANIDVRVHGRVLQLKAEQKHESSETKGRTYLRQERSVQEFERAFELPEAVDADQVKARYEDGVLHVTVPKAHPVTERKVEVAQPLP